MPTISSSPLSKTEIPKYSCVRKIKKEWRGLLVITPAVVAAVGTNVDDSPETVGMVC